MITPFSSTQLSSKSELCIQQLDGNISLISDNDISINGENLVYNQPQPEEVTSGVSGKGMNSGSQENHINNQNSHKVSQSLPVISWYNMRSVVPKAENFVLDFKNLGCDISFLNELWYVDKEEHNKVIEELPHMDGI